MKKLMIAAAAAFCGTVFGLESANIVGYMDVAKKSGYNFAGGGSMFVTPGATSYSLAQLAITGPANKNVARMNYIQFMAAGTAAKLDATKSYYYFGGKWYSRTGTSAVTDPEVSDPTSVTVSAGQGFLTCLPFATAKITYNGEVITGTDKAITIEKPTGYNFFIAANPCASEISLSDITITGPGNKNIARMNYIQSFASGTAAKLDALTSPTRQEKFRSRISISSCPFTLSILFSALQRLNSIISGLLRFTQE